ncbi:MAG: hypothetical protein U1E63_10755 [Burkholderiales bacterium]
MIKTNSRFASFMVGAVLLCGGCATLTTSSSQTVTVQTEPGGAVCTFVRDGEVVGLVNPTPGTLAVSKSRRDMTVRCDKEGYLEATGTVGSRFQAMTFGNILFGGLVGVVIDASSGAMTKYEPQITITLIPAVFATAEERDQFFDQRASQFAAEAGKVKQRIREKCQPENCERELKLADEEEAAGLARIAHQRETASVKSQETVGTRQRDDEATVVGGVPPN